MPAMDAVRIWPPPDDFDIAYAGMAVDGAASPAPDLNPGWLAALVA
ncbi:MAG: hypothetical protein ACK4UW_05155 [Rhizobium rhizophilum]